KLGNQVTVVIPAGALLGGETINISSKGAAPAEYMHASGLFQFGPAGLHFAVPVQVVLPVSAAASMPSVFWSPDGAAGFDSLGGLRAGPFITPSDTHFS